MYIFNNVEFKNTKKALSIIFNHVNVCRLYKWQNKMIAMLNKTLTFMKLQLKETDKGYVLTDVLILFGICLFSILYKAFELRSQLALLFKF